MNAGPLRREAVRLAAAIVMLTRIPVPIRTLPSDWLPRAAKYFPLVGALIGLLQGLVFVALAAILPAALAAMLSIAAALLLTGAFHEDGLADTFDSFGGASAEARLAIMKDSRIGTYGTLALLAALALQAAALPALPPAGALAVLVAAHAGARLAGVLLMSRTVHAGDPAQAKIALGPDRIAPGEVLVATAFALAAALPAFLADPLRTLAALICAAAAARLMAWRGCRGLGGHTGDVLGAVASVFLTAFLVASAAEWRGP